MAVTIKEHAFSRKITVSPKSPKGTKLYYAVGSMDEDEILAAVEAEIAATFGGLVLDSIDLEPRGGGFWDVSVSYALADSSDLDGQGSDSDPAEPTESPSDQDDVGPEFSADTAGGNVHITQSLKTLSSKAAVGDAPNYKRAIGVTKEKVEGVDIFAGKLEFSMTFKLPFIKWKYIKTCKNLTNKVNSVKWMVFEPGEVLYLGASFAFKGDDGWTVTHKFAAGENDVFITVSDSITLVPADRSDGDTEWAKYAWEYLWCDYIETEEDNILTQRPRAAYIEQVYKYDDLKALGFGKVTT